MVAIQSDSIEVTYITSTCYTEQCARAPCACRCMNTWSATQLSGMWVQQLWVNDRHQLIHTHTHTKQTPCSWAVIMINMELTQFAPIQICILHRGITRIVYFEPTCKHTDLPFAMFSVVISFLFWLSIHNVCFCLLEQPVPEVIHSLDISVQTGVIVSFLLSSSIPKPS